MWCNSLSYAKIIPERVQFGVFCEDQTSGAGLDASSACGIRRPVRLSKVTTADLCSKTARNFWG